MVRVSEGSSHQESTVCTVGSLALKCQMVIKDEVLRSYPSRD